MATMKMPITVGTGGDTLPEISRISYHTFDSEPWTADKDYKMVVVSGDGRSAYQYVLTYNGTRISAGSGYYSQTHITSNQTNLGDYSSDGYYLTTFKDVKSGDVINAYAPTFHSTVFAFE